MIIYRTSYFEEFSKSLNRKLTNVYLKRLAKKVNSFFSENYNTKTDYKMSLTDARLKPCSFDNYMRKQHVVKISKEFLALAKFDKKDEILPALIRLCLHDFISKHKLEYVQELEFFNISRHQPHYCIKVRYAYGVEEKIIPYHYEIEPVTKNGDYMTKKEIIITKE